MDREAVGLAARLPLRSVREALSVPIGEPLDKPGLDRWRRRSRVVLQDEAGQERVVYVKRFAGLPLGAQIERMRLGAWGHGTAWVEWNNIRRLRAAGVPTMRPVAFAEQMAGPWEIGSLLCTEQVAGESLEKWLPAGWERAVGAWGAAWRGRVVVQLAEMVGRMHAANLCHRDLYTCHIFIKVEPDGRVSFRLIDLQRMFRVRLRKRRWWVKDLAALGASAPRELISRTDRMRFLKAYLGRDARDGEVRRWWKDVERKAARMMRHHAARMERLAATTRT